MAEATYLRMLREAQPYLAPLLLPTRVWITDIRHDPTCPSLAADTCSCRPEIYYWAPGEERPRFRLILTDDDHVSIEINETGLQ